MVAKEGEEIYLIENRSRWFYSLEQYLEETTLSEGKEGAATKLLEFYHIVRNEMHRNLKAVWALFPHYSEHDEDHSKRIIFAVEQFLGRDRIQQLTPADAFLILICAYLHDLGMIILDEEVKQAWGREEFQLFLQACKDSMDEDLRKASRCILEKAIIQDTKHVQDWPIYIKRYVIELTAEFFRSQHAGRVNELQKEPFRKLLNLHLLDGGKLPHPIENLIIRITSAHGEPFSFILRNLPDLDQLYGMDVHPRFVAVLLRIGDLCDVDNRRFNLAVLKTFGEMGQKNAVHYWMNQSITSFSIKPDCIRASSDVRYADIKHQLPEAFTEEQKLSVCNYTVLETKRWFTWIEEECRNIRLHWHELMPNSDIAAAKSDPNYQPIFPPMSPTISYEILVNGQTAVTSDVNLRFIFSNEKAYSLIEGYSLYDDQLVFVRELIQNSLDALKIQMWRDLLAGRWDHLLQNQRNKQGSIDYQELQPFDFSNNSIYEYYKVHIAVKHHEDDETARFIITDNGTGISRLDLENCILLTGSSWHQGDAEQEVKSMPGWLQPTGSFGIGLHAVFVLSDKIQIRTKTEQDAVQHTITLHSGQHDGYVFMNAEENSSQWVSFCGSKARGTELSVRIHMDKYRGVDWQDHALKEDPFIQQPESNFCAAIKQKIDSLFRSPLFQIRYDLYEQKTDFITTAGHTTMLCMDNPLFDTTKRNTALLGALSYQEDPYDYALSHMNLDVCVWDRENGMLCHFAFHPFSNTHDNVFCCKGVLMGQENLPQPYPWLTLFSVDLLGGDSKQMLNTARTACRIEKKQHLYDSVEMIYHFLARLYQQVAIALFSHKDCKTFLSEIASAVTFDIDDTSNDESIQQDFNRNLTDLFQKHDLGDLQNKKSLMFPLLFQANKELLYSQRSYILKTIQAYPANRHAYNKFSKTIAEECAKSCLKNTRLRNWILFLSSFTNDMSSDFAFTFGSAFGSAFGRDFGRDFGLTFSLTFSRDFGRAFGRVFGRAFGRAFGNEFGLEFGEALNQTDSLCICAIVFPIMSISYLSIVTKEQNETFIHNLSEFLEKEPGFASGYGFTSSGVECYNVCNLLCAQKLSIKNKLFTGWIRKKFPVFDYCPCAQMTVAYNHELELHFDQSNPTRRCMDLDPNSHIKVLAILLQQDSDTQLIPAFTSYERIAIEHSNDFADREPACCTKNFCMPLWRKFKDMDSYAPRLPHDKQALTDEIMAGQDKVAPGLPNLLRYIYRNNAYKKRLKSMGYEKAMQGIADTYRCLVEDVLDCVNLIYNKDNS